MVLMIPLICWEASEISFMAVVSSAIFSLHASSCAAAFMDASLALSASTEVLLT